VLQKASFNLRGGVSNVPFGDGGGGTPLDPETMGLALPVAAIALASLSGYKLANRMTDEKAAQERRERIKQNLNRLGKLNLSMMKEVRKEAGLVGTMVNPFQGVAGLGGQLYLPDWFRLIDSPYGQKGINKADALAFKTLALASTYGAGAFGIKYLLGAMDREKEQREGNKRITEAVKASMPILSPDPSLKDLAKEEKEQMSGLQKNVLLKDAEESKTPWDNWLTSKAVGVEDESQSTLSGTAKAVLALLALGSFGAGAVLTKQWADERDPNRQRVKAAEKAAQRYALQQRPPAIIGAIDPKIKKQLDKHISEGRLRIRPKKEEEEQERPEVDPTDSLARNVAVV
jgi:hypothetical protein